MVDNENFVQEISNSKSAIVDPFDQIWESSRTNDYSWGYPAVVWAGVGVLVGLSLIRHNVLRWILKVVAIVGLAMTATHWSSSEIPRF